MSSNADGLKNGARKLRFDRVNIMESSHLLTKVRIFG
jgi:hypothetical protein